MKILVINGPNLNMLGIREPGIYGSSTFADLLALLEQTAKEENLEIQQYQSNHEGDLVDKIQWAYGKIDGIVINPAAYTHTSVAIRDAVAAVRLPTVEVHLSNVFSREEYRHRSYLAEVAWAVVSGMGFLSYEMALRGLAARGKE